MTIHVPAWLLWTLVGVGGTVAAILLCLGTYALLCLWMFTRGTW